MSKKCEEGLEYDCPYLHVCKSDRGKIILTNPKNPYLIYIRSKEWSPTTKTWSDNEDIYSCQPQIDRCARNMELMFKETFYGKDLKKIRENTLEEVQEAIKGLLDLQKRR